VCDAALAIADKSGLSAVTINEISAKTGIPPTSIYRFFRDKGAIVEYIYAQWAEEVRAVWQRLESDPAMLNLPWLQFFQAVSQEWKLPTRIGYHRLLDHADAMFPGVEAIKRSQRQHFADFFCRHMARYNARGTIEEWRDLAFYLAAIDEELSTPLTADSFSSQAAAQTLFNKTVLSLIGELMPDA